MSSEQDQIRALAERVARRVAASEPKGAETGADSDLSTLRAGLDQIQRRLAHIESHIKHDDSCEAAPRGGESARPAHEGATSQSRQESGSPDSTPTRSLWLSGTYVPAVEHPSQERFGVGEAVSEMVDYFEREKTCNVEPGGKPCDHCGMCSSRGF
jgi:hypothetical protein